MVGSVSSNAMAQQLAYANQSSNATKTSNSEGSAREEATEKCSPRTRRNK